MRPRPWSMLAAMLFGACSSRPDAGPEASDKPVPNATQPLAATDTVRGVLRIVGSEPATQLVLSRDAERIALLVDRDALLWRAAGLDVCLRFQRAGDRAQIVGYTVRGISGSPALDGIVGSGATFQTATGAKHSLVGDVTEALVIAGVRIAYSAGASALVVLGTPSLPVDSLATSCDASAR